MEIKGKRVLILGGWGLVGSAIARELVEHEPERIVLCSLEKWQTDDAVRQMGIEFPGSCVKFEGEFGDVFQRTEFKHLNREEILRDPDRRRKVMNDLIGDFNRDLQHAQFLYDILARHRPEIIVDCINSATAFAYQDIYRSSLEVAASLDRYQGPGDFPGVRENVERLLCTSYTAQLIRHVQILFGSMVEVGTKIYVKIGTSGTGGMGLNIPYTHSEERPSKMLLSKSAVAGAHTLLLFLMGRTPDGPIIKEFKPTALIAWKKIEHGKISRRGKPVKLYDLHPNQAIKLEGRLALKPDEKLRQLLEQSEGGELDAVFIDTGENGIFSAAEFEAITMLGQMQFITPEEIARSVVYEIKGGNTGHDVINALDQACQGPTYRAGQLRGSALQRMRELEAKHGVRGVAFEMLGPPKLSKLLWEAELLRRTEFDMSVLSQTSAEELSRRAFRQIQEDPKLRQRILSIGIPILLPDGTSLLRGPEIKVPAFRGEWEFVVTPANIDRWADQGWVDLRVSNFVRWVARLKLMLGEVEKIPFNDTSSRYDRNQDFWMSEPELNVGKLAGWIFIHEDKGGRMKS
ncbi:MAG: short-chain dehydrogenase [Candidatus Riflebacteria bacterium]|nr:short-chain dehydrogenase [Candidatus Riflebacteria bacterium]